MCTTLFLRDISACNCVVKTTIDQGDYLKVIPKVGSLLKYKTSEYPLIKEVFFLIHSLQGRHFLSTSPLESFFFGLAPTLGQFERPNRSHCMSTHS